MLSCSCLDKIVNDSCRQIAWPISWIFNPSVFVCKRAEDDNKGSNVFFLTPIAATYLGTDLSVERPNKHCTDISVMVSYAL